MPAERLARRRHPVVRQAAASPRGQARFVGPTGIALITVAAILTLRGFPSTAEYGWASIAYYILGRAPLLHSARACRRRAGDGMAAAGGLYAWVQGRSATARGSLRSGSSGSRTSSGSPPCCRSWPRRWPTSSTRAWPTTSCTSSSSCSVVFWALTLANFFGDEVDPACSTTRRRDRDTLIPAAVLIALGRLLAGAAGRSSAIPFNAHKLLPNLSSISNLVFFVGVVLGFAGIEMAGFHAKETQNPRARLPAGRRFSHRADRRSSRSWRRSRSRSSCRSAS